MTTAASRPERDKCEAKRTRHGGAPCQLPAGWGTDHVGIGSCKLHGGSTMIHRKNATRVQAQRDITAFGGRSDITAPEALLELVQAKATEVAYWDQRVAELDDNQRAGMLLAKTEQGYGPQGPVNVETKQAGPHVYVAMLHKAQDQLATYSAAAIRAGIDEQLVKIATIQAAWLVPTILQTIALARTQPSLDPQDVARTIIEGAHR